MNNSVVADQQSELNQDRLLLNELTPEEYLLIWHYRGLMASEQEFMLRAIEALDRLNLRNDSAGQ